MGAAVETSCVCVCVCVCMCVVMSGGFSLGHTREKHNGVAERRCDCGQAFAQKSNFDRHQDICILSKWGATKAIKRRFEQLSERMDDRNIACTQAFADIREMAQKRLECVCTGCAKHFKNEGSLKKHKCSKQA